MESVNAAWVTCSESCRLARRRKSGKRYDAKRRPLTIRTGLCKSCGAPWEAIGPGPRLYCDEHQRYETRRGKRVYNPGNSWRYHIKHRWGLTPETWDEMLARQGGGCAICGEPVEPGRRLVVDHDHACCAPSGMGKTCGRCVRAILCHGCNTGVGYFKDDPARLRAAADYLERHQGANP